MSNPIAQDLDLSLLNSSESESGSLNGVDASEEAEIQVLHETGPEVEVISGPTPVVRARASRGPPGYEVVGARALEDAPAQPREVSSRDKIFHVGPSTHTRCYGKFVIARYACFTNSNAKLRLRLHLHLDFLPSLRSGKKQLFVLMHSSCHT